MNTTPSPLSDPQPSASWPAAPLRHDERVAHPKGTVVLVLGILGMVCFGALTGLPALLIASSALRDTRREPLRFNNQGTLQAGMWLGVASTVLSVLALVAFVLAGAAKGLATYREAAKPASKTETYSAKNGLLRAHYPAAFAASSPDTSTIVLAHHLGTVGDEAVVLGAVIVPISNEVPEFARVLDVALTQNYVGYVEVGRRETTCLGGAGLETTGRFSFQAREYQRWACSFIRDGHGYHVSYVVTDADAALRGPILRSIIDATELVQPR